MNNLNVSILQYDIAWKDNDANLRYIIQKMPELPTNTDVLILPEMFNTGVTTDVEEVHETMWGVCITTLKSEAHRFNIAICGSILIQEENKFYNRFVFITPEGEMFQYDKRHLFNLGGEHLVCERGTDNIVFEYKGWRIKPQICYDLRFPVWSRNSEKYDLLIYVSNWPKSRGFAYTSLLKARAIENQSYLCACNRIGTDGNKIVYNGSSCVIDAKGDTLGDAEEKELLLNVSLSKEELIKFRERFPVLEDRDDFEIKA
jgi:omega-amidase